MIQHTVFFKFPSVACEVPESITEIVIKFNSLEGIIAQVRPHGIGIEGSTSKAEFLASVDWPDKTDDYTHCLLVVAADVAALKNYLHSDEHLKEWMSAVKPYIQGILVFDNALGAPAVGALLKANAIQHTVFFRFPSIAAEVPSLIAELVVKFNALPGIVTQIYPHGVGIEGSTSKAEFLATVDWPDKTDDYTHCLLVVAADAAALKRYLHSDEHLKEWMPAVEQFIQGVLVVDNTVEPAFAAALNVAKEKVEAVAEMKAFQFKAAVIDAAMRAVETSATEPPKMLATTTTSDDLNGSVLCENEMLVRIPSLGKSLTLGLIQSEWEIEPMFSGAAWAGSVLWAAASVLCEHCLLNGLVPVAGTSVLELGCGLGIPGMVSAVLGASEVALTEQPQLVPLLEKNLQRNSSFFSLDDLSVGVQPAAFALSWGTVEAQAFLDARGGKRFDTILICDCVFEPLYGDSWKLLCETLFVLADFSTNVLIASERRSEDSIPEFQAMLERDFDLKIVWNSFEEEELDTLLKNSHIQGHKKPLRIISAKRR